MSTQDVVLCNPVRTAIGTYGGTLKSVPATKLGAITVSETLARAKLDPAAVETAVMGNVIQAGNKMNPSRQAAIEGGLPVEVPAMTVNRVCGSGAQAIASAAQEVWLGNLDCAVAGGMENMDRAPYLMGNGRWGYRMGDAEIYDSMLRDGLNDAFSGEHSGWHTEDLVTKFQLTREEQDRWALRSQQRFAAAQEKGAFEAEIVTVAVPARKGPIPFAKDEHNRPQTTAESLAKLRPAFRKDGTITAGNAPGLNRAAAAAQHPQAGRRQDVGFRLLALVAVGEERVAVGINEIRRAERPQARGEVRDQRISVGARRNAAVGVAPQRRHPVQQGAKGPFRIGLPHRPIAARREVRPISDGVEVAVMCEGVDAPAELADEGLGVAKPSRALGGVADMRQDEPAAQRVGLEKAYPRALARRLRILDQADIVVLVIGDAPAVFVRPLQPAMAGERPQRQRERDAAVAGEGKELAHGGPEYTPGRRRAKRRSTMRPRQRG